MGIERVPTESEKREYKSVGSATPKEVFLKQIAIIEAKFTKEHKPFDGQCARLDFQDEIKRVEREAERKYGYVRVEDLQNLKFENLEKYGDMDRFEFDRDDEDIEFMNVNGVRTPTVVGHTVAWKCKERGHGISVFMPNAVYAEYLAGKKGGK